MSALNNIKTIKKDILRFIACGSVDDGKSTFIGRLLYDTGSVFDDQLATLEKESKSIGNAGKEIDFSLLVDGLSSEREQGITIDVAYRYFETESRKFIIADTPGHEQYTRNMATAASNADLAVILIDAKNGVLPQSKRHSFIASLCGIKYAIVAVNKMDVVEYKEEVFENIKKEFLEATKTLGFEKLFFVPISALKGENIVTKSEKTPWYKKESLLELLESVKIKKEEFVGFRLPIQLVNRPDRTFRGFCGTIASGEIAVNESIKVYPSKEKAKIKELIVQGEKKDSAKKGEAVTLVLDKEIDISRGDMIVKGDEEIKEATVIEANLVWMDSTPIKYGSEYYIKHAGATFVATADEILHKIDVNSYKTEPSAVLEMNDIGVVRLNLSKKIAFDSYKNNRTTGAFILIDKITNAVSGGGMIINGVLGEVSKKREYSEFEINLNRLIRESFPHWKAIDISQE